MTVPVVCAGAATRCSTSCPSPADLADPRRARLRRRAEGLGADGDRPRTAGADPHPGAGALHRDAGPDELRAATGPEGSWRGASLEGDPFFTPMRGRRAGLARRRGRAGGGAGGARAGLARLVRRPRRDAAAIAALLAFAFARGIAAPLQALRDQAVALGLGRATPVLAGRAGGGRRGGAPRSRAAPPSGSASGGRPSGRGPPRPCARDPAPGGAQPPRYRPVERARPPAPRRHGGGGRDPPHGGGLRRPVRAGAGGSRGPRALAAPQPHGCAAGGLHAIRPAAGDHPVRRDLRGRRGGGAQRGRDDGSALRQPWRHAEGHLPVRSYLAVRWSPAPAPPSARCCSATPNRTASVPVSGARRGPGRPGGGGDGQCPPVRLGAARAGRFEAAVQAVRGVLWTTTPPAG